MTWLVAFLSDNEFKVASRIEKTREDYFLPTYRDREGRERPLYPGYLFYRYHHRWPQVLEIRGVARVLGETIDEQFWPHRVADEFIDSLRDYAPIDTSMDGCVFSPGEMVRIINGAHTGLFGQFQRYNRGKGIVLVDYFNRSVPLSIPLHFLANPYLGASALGETRQRAGA